LIVQPSDHTGRFTKDKTARDSFDLVALGLFRNFSILMKSLLLLYLCTFCEPVFAEWHIITRKPFTPPGMIVPVHMPRPGALGALADLQANPYRQIGTNLYNLGYLLQWDTEENKRYGANQAAGRPFVPTNRPLRFWTEFSGRVEAIRAEGVVVRAAMPLGRRPGMIRPQLNSGYCVRHFPGASVQMIGKDVSFFARSVGSLSHRKGPPSERFELEMLDYGVPVNGSTKRAPTAPVAPAIHSAPVKSPSVG
jgi:hypothetical protein